MAHTNVGLLLDEGRILKARHPLFVVCSYGRAERRERRRGRRLAGGAGGHRSPPAARDHGLPRSCGVRSRRFHPFSDGSVPYTRTTSLFQYGSVYENTAATFILIITHYSCRTIESQVPFAFGSALTLWLSISLIV